MVALALLLAAALCASALADVQLGDKGEEVRYLQWLLYKTRWLREKPDGAFGPHTEEAVKAYQESKGLEATGVADAQLMLELDRDRVLRDKEAHGQDYYEPYTGDFTPPLTASETASSHCSLTVLPDIAYKNSCERHLGLIEKTLGIDADDPEALSAGAALWQADFEALYAELSESGTDKRKARLEKALAAWQAAVAAQREALAAVLGDAAAEAQVLLMLENCSETLCELRAEKLPEAASVDALAGMAGGDAHCAKWAITADKQFITACGVHSPLYARESEWLAAGAEDAEALTALAAAWDEALDAQYAALAQRLSDPAPVTTARDAFARALALQDRALMHLDTVTLGHIRLVQLESARLCELLGE